MYEVLGGIIRNQRLWFGWPDRASHGESAWRSRVGDRGGRCRYWLWGDAGHPVVGSLWLASAGIPVHSQVGPD